MRGPTNRHVNSMAPPRGGGVPGPHGALDVCHLGLGAVAAMSPCGDADERVGLRSMAASWCPSGTSPSVPVFDEIQHTFPVRHVLRGCGRGTVPLEVLERQEELDFGIVGLHEVLEVEVPPRNPADSLVKFFQIDRHLTYPSPSRRYLPDMAQGTPHFVWSPFGFSGSLLATEERAQAFFSRGWWYLKIVRRPAHGGGRRWVRGLLLSGTRLK
ncbi:hypothetical protein QF050_002606 [Arthrobacter sp. SLBN-112]|nr:hypothetical protein [Arthrobacter sp. SLBN-112]